MRLSITTNGELEVYEVESREYALRLVQEFTEGGLDPQDVTLEDGSEVLTTEIHWIKKG